MSNKEESETSIDPRLIKQLWKTVDHDCGQEPEDAWEYAVAEFLEVKEMFRPIILAEHLKEDQQNEVTDLVIIEMARESIRRMSPEDKLEFLRTLMNADHPLNG